MLDFPFFEVYKIELMCYNKHIGLWGENFTVKAEEENIIKEDRELFAKGIIEGINQGEVERNFEHRLTEVIARSKGNQRRIEKIEKRQDDLDELVGVVKVLADREERVEGVVEEIKNDVKTLTDKPARRWDKLVEVILTVIAGALIGFVLAKIGL